MAEATRCDKNTSEKIRTLKILTSTPQQTTTRAETETLSSPY
jgi:hypothetical protein